MDTAPKPEHQEEKAKQPVMDVVPPKSVNEPQKPAPADGKPAPKSAPKPRAQHDNGVGLAILASVIIVLGLAVLFVYAYLRSNGVSLL